MSAGAGASQSPDPIPHSVAETLSVITDGQAEPVNVSVTVTQSGLAAQAVPASSIPSVGASISVPDGGSATSLTDRSSSALLNLASSCSLTEILTAQQQALEQFQCQLQLAQQTEAINQRLDAIERTLNSLIQQRAHEEAAKTAAVAAAAAVATSTPVSTPLRPSQQLQLPGDSSPGDSKKKKLPRELCSKVRSTYNSLGLEFKIDERFLSPNNQRVTDALIDQVYSDCSGVYNVKDIKRAVHRYYESRRRIGIEELPERQGKAAEQKKRRKYRARQQRSYDRRRKFVRDSEQRYWQFISPACMTEESDMENSEKIVTHQLHWRSEFLNQFVVKLDARYERARRPGPGVSASARRERLDGHTSTSQPPPSLPSWMVDINYQQTHPSSVMTVPISLPISAADLVNSSPMHGDGSTMVASPTSVSETTAEEVAYTSLIDLHGVHDDSSDFELPESVTGPI